MAFIKEHAAARACRAREAERRRLLCVHAVYVRVGGKLGCGPSAMLGLAMGQWKELGRGTSVDDGECSAVHGCLAKYVVHVQATGTGACSLV
jgi:hypothetical protein